MLGWTQVSGDVESIQRMVLQREGDAALEALDESTSPPQASDISDDPCADD